RLGLRGRQPCQWVAENVARLVFRLNAKILVGAKSSISLLHHIRLAGCIFEGELHRNGFALEEVILWQGERKTYPGRGWRHVGSVPTDGDKAGHNGQEG